MATNVKGRHVDADTEAILYGGANLSQLGKLFRMDHRQLVEKMHGIAPTGERSGHPTWFVHEVAPYLVKPIYEIETYIKRMHHNDLPKHLTKEFWAGLRSKQEYEIKQGDLWPTERVVTAVGGFMKLVKMAVRLMADQVHRQVELTPRQRQIIVQQGDGLLEELYRSILESFKAKPSNPDTLEMVESTIISDITPTEEDDDEL